MINEISVCDKKGDLSETKKVTDKSPDKTKIQQIQKMEQISSNLPNEKRYLILHKHKKRPKGLDWNKKPFTKTQVNKTLNDNNAGFLLGKGYLCIDCDSLELQEAVEGLIKTPTYTQRSARKGLNQYIYKIGWVQDSFDLKFKGELVGDILADTKAGKGKQVVLAPSRYQITKEDIEKNPKLKLKLGEIKDYTVINDIPIAEITKEAFMKVILEFETKKTKEAIQETKELKQKSSIDDLSITSIISTAGMQQEGNKYVGSNPWHGSTGGHNFYITPSLNLAYCFHSGCDCAISPAKAIALNEGIINNCSDDLKGMDFIKTVEIAEKKYGLKNTITLNDNINSDFKTDEKPELNFWTVKDYENYREPKNYIIEGLDFENEIAMNYGQTGSLKSVNMLYKAVCISSGRDYLGKYKTKKNPVCILSAENGILTDKERLIAIRKGMNIRKKDTELYILPRHECQDILHWGFKESLFDFLQEKKIKVLFLDTINPLTPELDDISIRDVTKLFNEFLKPVADMGIRVEFLHHTDKQGKQFLGSMKFKANCDCATRIDRDNLSDTFKLYNEKNRRGESNVLEIKFQFISNEKKELKKINAVLIDDERRPEIFEKKKKPSKTAKFKTDLLNSIPENMEITREEIIEIFIKDINDDKISIPTIDRYLKEMVVLEKLISVEKGVYKKC